MEIRVQGTNMDPSQYDPRDWTQVLRAQANLRETRNATHELFDAAARSPYNLPKIKQLPPLPLDGFKVVFRSQGGLDLTTLQPRYLLTALMQAVALTDPSTLTLRIHPVNNTCTVSAVNEKDALKLVQLQHITYDKHEYAMTAYIAPPQWLSQGCYYKRLLEGITTRTTRGLDLPQPTRNYTRRSTNGTHAIDSHYLWTSHRPTKNCLWWRTASVHALYTKGRDVQ
ncbi:hypothetical protein MRX96_011380 [Rhipicephalus microplus]